MSCTITLIVCSLLQSTVFHVTDRFLYKSRRDFRTASSCVRVIFETCVFFQGGKNIHLQRHVCKHINDINAVMVVFKGTKKL